MTGEQLLAFALQFGKTVLSNVLSWFIEIFNRTGMTGLWIGVVVLMAVFSIVIIPLRGGADLSKGALGSFVMNRTNRHKGSFRNDD